MKYLFPIILLIMVVSSCTINKNVMFKTDREFEYDTPNDTLAEYKLSPNDRFVFRILTNKGDNLLTNIQRDNGQGRAIFNPQNEINYNIEADGTVKLPLIGQTEVAGMTITEAEIFLEEQYTPVFREAFVQIVLTNNRVIVFPGSGGDAQVIGLENRNTTVIEALASAGGISQRGNASRVKLIRQIDNQGEPEVYLLDLSTIEGIQQAQMFVQAYDVIYVEPVPEIANEVLRDVAPIVSLLSSFTILTAFLINR